MSDSSNSDTETEMEAETSMSSVAESMFNKLKKFKKEITQQMTNEEVLTFFETDEFKELYQKKEKQLLNEFEEIARIEMKLRRRYNEVCVEKGYKIQYK